MYLNNNYIFISLLSMLDFFKRGEILKVEILKPEVAPLS